MAHPGALPPRAIAAALLFLLLGTSAAESQVDRRLRRVAQRDDAMKARRPYCVPVEGLCPVVFGAPQNAAIDTLGSSAEHGPTGPAERPLWRTLLGETLDVYAGVAYTPRTRFGKRRDGTVIVGGAFGDPGRLIRVETALAFFSTLDTGFGERMGFDVRLDRLLPGDVLASLGWENVATRGSSDIGSSRYIVLTRWFERHAARDWLSHVVVTAGAADGRFSSERDWIERAGGWNLIGSVGVQIAPPVLFLLEWPGDDLTVAAAVAPSRAIPIVLTPALTDVTGNAGDGIRFVVSATYVLRLRTPS